MTTIFESSADMFVDLPTSPHFFFTIPTRSYSEIHCSTPIPKNKPLPVFSFSELDVVESDDEEEEMNSSQFIDNPYPFKRNLVTIRPNHKRREKTQPIPFTRRMVSIRPNHQKRRDTRQICKNMPTVPAQASNDPKPESVAVIDKADDVGKEVYSLQFILQNPHPFRRKLVAIKPNHKRTDRTRLIPLTERIVTSKPDHERKIDTFLIDLSKNVVPAQQSNDAQPESAGLTINGGSTKPMPLVRAGIYSEVEWSEWIQCQFRPNLSAACELAILSHVKRSNCHENRNESQHLDTHSYESTKMSYRGTCMISRT